MKKVEILLVQLMEEAAEVQQRASKAVRFGLNEIQPNQKLTNLRRLQDEVADFAGTLECLKGEGVDLDPKISQVTMKAVKITEFLEYSRELGILKER